MTFNVVLPFLQGISTTVLFILVMRQRKLSAESRFFSAFLASLSLWGFFIAIMRSSSGLEFALYWEKAALITIASTTVSFYLFTTSYTRARPRVAMVLSLLYLVVTLAGAPTSLLVERIGQDKFGNAPDWGLAFYPWIAIMYVLIFMSVMNLIRARRASKEYEERNRYTYIILGASICLAGGFVDVLSAAGLPIYPGLIIANIIFALLTSLAILQYHLFDIQVMVRSTFAYIFTGIIVVIPVAAAGTLWALVAQAWRIPLWAVLAPFALFVFAVPPIWGRVEGFVMRHVRREKYVYLKALDEFRRTRVNITEVGELCSWIVDLVVSSLDPSSVALFVLEDANYRVAAHRGASASQPAPALLSATHPLVMWLAEKRELVWRRQLDISPELQAMSQADREALNRLGAELHDPIGTGVLTGILALGPKSRGKIYSREDLEFLGTLSREVALELENMRLYAQERATRQELQHQNDQKTEFLHHVAHELKTPLTAIISSSEMMSPDDLVNMSQEHRRRLMTNINRGAWLMDKKVSELLDLARIQIGRVELKLEPVDLPRLIDELTSQLSSLFTNKEQVLEFQYAPDLPAVRADKERTIEVVLNLLSNANKFSRAGGCVYITASEAGGMVLVEVKDAAPSIPEADRARIFDPYYRGGTVEDQQRVAGLGLGLAISKSLVNMQKGEIGVTVENEGGNTFYFTLPVWQDEE